MTYQIGCIMNKNKENYEQLSFLGAFGVGNAEGTDRSAGGNSTETEDNRQADKVEKKGNKGNIVNNSTKNEGIDTNSSALTSGVLTKSERNSDNSIDSTRLENNSGISRNSTRGEEISGISRNSTIADNNSIKIYNATKSDIKSRNNCDLTKGENISVDIAKSTETETHDSEKGESKGGAVAMGGKGERDKDWDFFNELFSFRNLYRAHLRSRNSKRFVPSVVDYEMHISSNIIRLRYEVLRGEYAINAYKKFYIYEPKKRLIQACAYVDRVVQHCLCDNYLTGLIDSKLIYDNCACRKNKGLDFAVRRVKKHLQAFYNKYGTDGYCLRVDISKYFQSIDKEIVLKKLNRHVTNRYIMGLIARIVLGYDSEGLPIGNQISQTLAIYYLNDVDRFIKEVCRVKYYTRYMDDFFILHHDKAFLEDLTRLIREECEKDKLTLNAKTMIIPIKQGIDFIGKNFMLEDNGAVTVRLRQVNKRRIYRRIKYVAQTTPISEQEIVHKRSVMASYTGLTKRIDGGRKLVFNARVRGERLARRRAADGGEAESE